MPTCPKGHDSTAADYCDECGTPINAAPSEAAGTGPAGSTGQTGPGQPAGASAPDGSAATCPVCGTPQSGRFCEADGYDFVAASLGGGNSPGRPDATTTGPTTTGGTTTGGTTTGGADAGGGGDGAAAPGGAWRAVVTADRAYFDRIRALDGPDAGGLQFPAFYPERKFELVGGKMLIGRRSRSAGIEPDIDLAVPPQDPGVSHAHAMLVSDPDGGGWSVVDLDSSNGTYVNDGADPIAANAPVPVSDGDRIHLGAWTTLTVHTG